MKSEIQIGDITSNIFLRAFGGTSEPGVADPYLSGYVYVYFEVLPSLLPNYTGLGNQEVSKVLSALAHRVTLPTSTLNKTTITGLGGKKWSVPTNVDVGDTATITFLEMSGTPIFNIIHGWVTMIRDIRMGSSNMKGADYTKKNYSATAYVITTKPDSETVESAFLLTGMFPQKDPYDSFGGDVATIDKVDIDVDFNVDNIWTASTNSSGQGFVLQKAQTIISTITATKQNLINWGG